MNNIKQLTTEELETRAASLRKTINNPFASQDMVRHFTRELKPIERELNRRRAA